MATEPNIRPLTALETGGRSSETILTTLSAYWTLAKPDVNSLVLVTTLVGFCLATPLHSHPFPLALLAHTLAGTFLVAAGSGALNQYVERRFDARMRRTMRRPLALGILQPTEALCFGLLMTFMGTIYLATAVNALSGFLAVLASVGYLLVYTPLKRITPFCTLVGAFPGAVPPLIGWAGASGHLSREAWVLYFLLFLWQFPHFMAIAWIYRDDYMRAGYLVLPQASTRYRAMTLQVLIPSGALIPVSLLSPLWGFTGWLSAAEVSGVTILFLYFGVQVVRKRTNTAARRLLLASLVYLPSILLMMMLDRA
jgi:protoheme IX farnesyltransferase